MKTQLISLLWTAVGLMHGVLLVQADQIAPAEGQATSNALVTVATEAPAAANPAPKTAFALKPVGIVKDVEKLTQSGTDPGVVKEFVQSWNTPYAVTADDILHLHDIGVPSDTLTTLIRHGGELSAGASSAANPYPQPQAVESNPPAVLYPYPEAPTPNYTEPPPSNYIEPAAVYTYPQYIPYYTSPWYGYSYPYGVGLSWYYWPSYGYCRYYPAYHHQPYYGGYYHAHSYYSGHSFGAYPSAGRSFSGGRSFAQHPGYAGHAGGRR